MGTLRLTLELATYISELNLNAPATSDPLAEADNHMRLIKKALLNTFPHFTAAALNSTQAAIDSAAAQVATYGFVPAGFIMDFAGSTAPAGWFPCDGWSLPRSDYPALFAAIGTTWGAADGAHFYIPNLASGGRFRRHRDNAGYSGIVGNIQAAVNLTHGHGMSGAPSVGTLGTDTQGNHHHQADIYDPQHSHTSEGPQGKGGTATTVGFGPGGILWWSSGALTSPATSTVSTGVRVNSSNGLDQTYNAGSHSHGVTGSPAIGTLAVTANGDANEARPYSATFLTCIKYQ